MSLSPHNHGCLITVVLAARMLAKRQATARHPRPLSSTQTRTSQAKRGKPPGGTVGTPAFPVHSTGVPSILHAEGLAGAGRPTRPSQRRKTAPDLVCTERGRQVAPGRGIPANGGAGGLHFPFENRDTISRFDHFYFCFHASILAALSWEPGGGGTHFLYHF